MNWCLCLSVWGGVCSVRTVTKPLLASQEASRQQGRLKGQA